MGRRVFHPLTAGMDMGRLTKWVDGRGDSDSSQLGSWQ